MKTTNIKTYTTKETIKAIEGGRLAELSLTAAELAALKNRDGVTALHLAAQHGCLDQIKDGVTADQLAATITPSDPSENPERETELKMDIENLVTAAKKLTKSQREVISLRFSSDLPIAEVARIMGKSEGAVKALQHSAVASLKKIMAVAETNER